jgi:hypothetical protein
MQIAQTAILTFIYGMKNVDIKIRSMPIVDFKPWKNEPIDAGNLLEPVLSSRTLP